MQIIESLIVLVKQLELDAQGRGAKFSSQRGRENVSSWLFCHHQDVFPTIG